MPARRVCCSILLCLQDVCVSEVARGFQKQTLSKVPEEYHAKIVDLLPLDLPLELAGQAIKLERYWKRRSQSQWTNCDVLKHGGSYKQLYFERHLQDHIEECAFVRCCAQGASCLALPTAQA